MRCPRLSALPSPPPDKTGWPWTEESPALLDSLPDGVDWPRVGIVTPSYNQGRFIEETIRSVLLQGYPNLEYFIIDGGSTDDSVDIIRKYEPWLAYWVSEPDGGQSHAINKGWARASGEIVAWLNSDDVYTPSALERVVEGFRRCPEAAVVHGACEVVDADGTTLVVRLATASSLATLLSGECAVKQPSAFIWRSALDDVGFLDESLYYLMDGDLWLRISLRKPMAHLPDTVLSKARRHEHAKTAKPSVGLATERLRVLDRFGSRADLPGELLQPSRRGRADARFRLAKAAARAQQPRLVLEAIAGSIRVWPPYLLVMRQETMRLLKKSARMIVRRSTGRRRTQ